MYVCILNNMENNLTYLEQLNEQQREAVVYIDGPSLVVAGAGSGKTRVLTYKIAYLLDQGLPPYSILSLTFTNKAAREMKSRIAAVTDEQTAQQLWMGTFHSIFSRILRQEAERIGYPTAFTIYDSEDSKNLIKAIIKEMQLNEHYRPGLVQRRISSAKNALISCEAYERDKELIETDIKAEVPYLRDIYRIYQERCFRAGAMDFDDLLMQTNVLFRDNLDVLDKYRGHFQYILVDEYQDTNFAQHLIVQKLSGTHQHICVVGDDAQSIYSFRGANIDNILQFQNQYPSCHTYKLEQNYRSSKNIVNAANSLIFKNKNQIRKNVYSEKEEGSKIQLISAYSDYEEAYIVATRITEMRMGKQHYNYADCAILYRTNAQSRVLEEAMRKRNIPYRIYGGMSFYQRKEIKDIVAYLRLLVNPNDEEALKRIINYPLRGIGDTTMRKLITAASTHQVPPWAVIQSPQTYELKVNAGTLSKLEHFKEMIEDFIRKKEKLNIDELVATVINRTRILEEFTRDQSIENISRRENVMELLKGISDFALSRLEEGSELLTLSDFLSEVSLFTDQDNESDADADRVILMTVHAAKGLEFKNVFVVGMEEDLFPSILSRDSARAIEEERRLFYVAITRAEENCVLTWSHGRYRNGMSVFCSPSRFLSDLDMSLLEIKGEPFAAQPERLIPPTPAPTPKPTPTFTPPPAAASKEEADGNVLLPVSLREGVEVRHSRFGTGTVMSTEGEGIAASAIIEFELFGTKKLILKYARLTLV